MTKEDRKKVGILLVLVAVLGVTAYLSFRGDQAPAAAAVAPATTQKPSANPPDSTEAHIRLDLLENPEVADEEIGKRNLFQYRQAPPPPTAGRGSVLAPPVNTPPQITSTPAAGQRPAGPLPPPPIPLRFQGLATGPQAGMVAFLADDQDHYMVRAGEILMGRYRIVSITEKTVEVEDLQFNRRQILPVLR